MEASGSGAQQRPIPRRSHKKSKTGCRTCKARKIKTKGIPGLVVFVEIGCADMAPTLSAMSDDPSVEPVRGTSPTSPPATSTTRTRRTRPPPPHPPPRLSTNRKPQVGQEREEAPPHPHPPDNNNNSNSNSNSSSASPSAPPPP
ncbi:hypothetical protein LTR29_011144 [Friedmanniomyces endolithicus]|nr:hypothetical protein LTR29_011144 [Friedmanniomyces endolithicus]